MNMFNTQFCSNRIIDQALIVSQAAKELGFKELDFMPVPYIEFDKLKTQRQMLAFRKAVNPFDLILELSEYEIQAEGCSTYRIPSTQANIYLIAFGSHWSIYYDSITQPNGGFPYKFAYTVLGSNYIDKKIFADAKKEAYCPLINISSLKSYDYYMLMDQLDLIVGSKLI